MEQQFHPQDISELIFEKEEMNTIVLLWFSNFKNSLLDLSIFNLIVLHLFK